jgi:Transposase DDE domain
MARILRANLNQPRRDSGIPHESASGAFGISGFKISVSRHALKRRRANGKNCIRTAVVGLRGERPQHDEMWCPLSARDLAASPQRWASSVRSAVERAFATMKRWYGMSRVRYLGLARNACHLKFVVMAMNMKRALALTSTA